MENNATRHRVGIVWSCFLEHDEFIFAESSQKSPSLDPVCCNMASTSQKCGQQNRVMLSTRTEMSAGMFKWLVKTVTQMIEADQMTARMVNFSFFTVSQRELGLKMVWVTDSVRHSEHKTVYLQRLHPLPVHWLEMGNKLNSFRIKEWKINNSQRESFFFFLPQVWTMFILWAGLLWALIECPKSHGRIILTNSVKN